MKQLLHYMFICYHRLLFKCHGIQYGKKLRVYDGIYFRKNKKARIIIGDRFTFTSGSGLNPISSNTRGVIRLDSNAKLFIGDNCGMSSTVLWAKESITIGNNVLMGGVLLLWIVIDIVLITGYGMEA